MLTGPVTILQWSFVRDDQPRRETCTADRAGDRATRCSDLEAAGIAAIQVDEPALREGLPLRRAEHADYLRWAVDAFRLATVRRRATTRRSTRTCATRSSTTSCEHIARARRRRASRSRPRARTWSCSTRFARRSATRTRSARASTTSTRRACPTRRRDRATARAAPSARVRRERLWVNPDCGLKTRGWNEVRPALTNLVAAAPRRAAAGMNLRRGRRPGSAASRSRTRKTPSTTSLSAYDVPFCPQLPRLDGDMITEWLGADPGRCGWSPARDRERPRAWDTLLRRAG